MQDKAYRVYILRTWREDAPPGRAAVWRFSLEDPQTRQRRGFADLESLMNFLAAGLGRQEAEGEEG